MKHSKILFLLLILTACSSEPNESAVDSGVLKKDTVNISLDEQPVKTIFDFLKWYRDHGHGITDRLVNNSDNKTYDSTDYYSVNFTETEHYLSTLKKTGFISDVYIDKWRDYFKRSDQNFKQNPSNEGPPNGFDYDLIMLSQDIDEDLKSLEKSVVVTQSLFQGNALITIEFPSGSRLLYTLTLQGDNWLIDGIKPE